MVNKEILNIAGKTVTVCICEKADAPTVFSNDFEDSADEVLAACREIGCPEFHLVSITRIRWDEELSPWPQAPVVTKNDNFTGEADSYLALLEDSIIPQVKALLPKSRRYVLNGYSMGGLFSLYAAQKSQAFDAYAAPSASVWYPGFAEYAKKQTFAKKPDCIYLSIGTKESRTRNPYLSQTESNMEELGRIFVAKGIPVICEKNPGNHYKDVPLRIAKGLKWIFFMLKNDE